MRRERIAAPFRRPVPDPNETGPKLSALSALRLTLGVYGMWPLTKRLVVRISFGEPNAFHRTLPSFWFTDYSAISPENGQYSTDLALSGRMQLTGKAAESAALWESADQFLTFSKLAGLLVNGRAQAIRAISTQAWRGDSAIRADLVVGVAGKFHKLFFERGC